MAENIQKGIIGILALLIGFGGSMFLTQSQIDSAYICTANENIGFFDSFSSTMKTGYWSDNLGDHSAVCRGGEWVKLTSYASEQGVDPSIFLRNQANPGVMSSEDSGIKYLCNSKTCEVIN